MPSFLERKILQPIGVWGDQLRYGDHEVLSDLADQCSRGVVHLLKDVYPDPTVRQACSYLDGACVNYSGRLVAPKVAERDAPILQLSGFYQTDKPGQAVKYLVAVSHHDWTHILVDIGIFQNDRLKLGIFTRLIQPSSYDMLFQQVRQVNQDTSHSIHLLTGPLRIVEEDATKGWKLELRKVGDLEILQEQPRSYDCFAGHRYDFEFTESDRYPEGTTELSGVRKKRVMWSGSA